MCYTLIVIGMRALPNQIEALRLMAKALIRFITALINVINPYHQGLSKTRVAFNHLTVRQK